MSTAATAAGDVSQWLQPLAAQLAPLKPKCLAVVAGLALPLRVQWAERLPAEAELLEPAGPALHERSGWLFQLPGAQAEARSLFVASDNETAVGQAQLEAAVALVRAAWRLAGGGADDDAAEIGEAIHALRNSLNSVLMSAAVVTTCADMLPERLQPIAREIEAAAARSVDRLHRLTGLIESRR
jgi:hypothetical protein